MAARGTADEIKDGHKQSEESERLSWTGAGFGQWASLQSHSVDHQLTCLVFLLIPACITSTIHVYSGLEQPSYVHQEHIAVPMLALTCCTTSLLFNIWFGDWNQLSQALKSKLLRQLPKDYLWVSPLNMLYDIRGITYHFPTLTPITLRALSCIRRKWLSHWRMCRC